MEEGCFRCDANVSIRPRGTAAFGTRAEIKNLNSFRSSSRPSSTRSSGRSRLLEAGGAVVQETRLWDADRDETVSMRSKEEAHDYRYFPEPDLPPLVVDEGWIEECAPLAARAARGRKPASSRSTGCRTTTRAC